MTTGPTLSSRALFLALTIALWFAPNNRADACGAFVAMKTPVPSVMPGTGAPAVATPVDLTRTLPFLTVEQVLLVWDKDTGTEDFIRETRFDRANQAFGFVVPTPTKPEVSAVKASPFAALRRVFPFDPPLAIAATPRRPGEMGGGAGGGAAAAVEPPVVVLSEERIGSFTAFTLSATDAGAFDKWLADNGFAMNEAAKPWLAHYVALKFFFVAFRYEPQTSDAGVGAAGATPTMKSETVRIRFHTPNPYYPYMEPTHSKGVANTAVKRMLSGWLVTTEAMKAIAYHHADATSGDLIINKRKWSRPWKDGVQYRESTKNLAALVGADLGEALPKSSSGNNLYVQTFRDLKTSRDGYGDVLIVPASTEPASKEVEEERKKLLAVIDPTLIDVPDAGATAVIDASKDEPAEDAAVKPTSDAGVGAPATRRASCAMTARTSSSSFALLFFALGVAAIVSARRLHLYSLVVLTVGCRRPAPTTTTEDAAAPIASVATTIVQDIDAEAPAKTVDERADQKRVAQMILAGELPPDGVDPSLQPGVPLKQENTPPPTPAAAVGGVSIEGGPIADADRVVAQNRSRFRSCYSKGLQTDPDMKGKLVIGGDINAAGQVTNAAVITNTGVSPATAACCVAVLMRARFAEREASAPPVKIKIPLVLSPQG